MADKKEFPRTNEQFIRSMRLLGERSVKEAGIEPAVTELDIARSNLIRFKEKMKQKKFRGENIDSREARKELKRLGGPFVKALAQEQAFDEVINLIDPEAFSQEPSVPGLSDPIQRERKFKADPRLREDFGTLLT